MPAGIRGGQPDRSVHSLHLEKGAFFDGLLGITMSGVAPTANDTACDSDTGVNGLQNFPVITSAVSDGYVTVAQGFLESAAGQAYQLQFYATPTVNQSGYWEGKKFLGTASLVLDGSCSNSFVAVLANSAPAGWGVTATATDVSNNTSEFSAAVALVGGGSSSNPSTWLYGGVSYPNGSVIPGATVVALSGSNIVASVATGWNGQYVLSLLSNGVYIIKASAFGHASSARVVTLNANTAQQNFQLKPLPSAPATQQVIRSATVNYTTGPLGSSLKVFNGTQFVPITAGNTPPTNRMTIVLTHGWVRNPLCGVNTGINGWPTDLARQLRVNGVTTEIANIVGWDWYQAADACPLPPEENTSAQGLALGTNLLAGLGENYSQPIHFFGHSLGALVNAAAANYLHGDRMAQQPVSATPWSASHTHMTLFDQAEVSRIAGRQVVFDGLTLALKNPDGIPALSALKFAAKTLQGWKPSMPMQSAWADNYISLVGFYLPNTFNIALQKAEGIALLRAASESANPVVIAAKTLEYAHSYPMEWYSNSIATPAVTPLGFQQSFEYGKMTGLPASTFPSALYQLGDAYHQTPGNSDQLALEPLPPENFFQLIVPLFGNGADAVVQGSVGVVHVVGDVAADIRTGAQAAGEMISQGFDYVSGVAAQGGQAVVNFFNSAVLRLRLHTTPPSSPSLMAMHGGPHPMDAEADGDSDSPPMAWLPIQFPSNATAMAFDFTVEGNPVDDVLVCGIGTNNLFSLEAKYIPTNTMSASRLIDVSAWAGTTNELFFGFMGGTSTNATLTIENIRFYSLATPRLEIVWDSSGATLTWPVTAGGYGLETTTNLAAATWEAFTNTPVIVGDHYAITNSTSGATRFFRLRQQ